MLGKVLKRFWCEKRNYEENYFWCKNEIFTTYKFGAKTLLVGPKKELNRSILKEDFGAKKEISGAKTELFGAKILVLKRV